MAETWKLHRVRPQSLLSFSYPSKDDALLGAYNLEGSWREFGLYIEAPNGERIEQQEIIAWCRNHFEELNKTDAYANALH